MFRTQKKFKHGRRFRPLSVDPYTVELEPEVENARKLVRVRPPAEERRHGRHFLLEEESILDFLVADEAADSLAPDLSSSTEDEENEDDFAEPARPGAPDRHRVVESLVAHNSKSPGLTGDDLETDWLAEELAAIREKAKNKRQKA